MGPWYYLVNPIDDLGQPLHALLRTQVFELRSLVVAKKGVVVVILIMLTFSAIMILFKKQKVRNSSGISSGLCLAYMLAELSLVQHSVLVLLFGGHCFGYDQVRSHEQHYAQGEHATHCDSEI